MRAAPSASVLAAILPVRLRRRVQEPPYSLNLFGDGLRDALDPRGDF
jgi:hypothetical protein